MLKLFQSPEQFLKQQPVLLEPDAKISSQVAQILSRVRKDGDAALEYFTEKFDAVSLETLQVPTEAIESAFEGLNEDIKGILRTAIENVRNFHLRQKPNSRYEKSGYGSQLGMQYTPIERVGVYVPGGKAGYPSTVIMTVVPAQIAGVSQLVLVSPPSNEGRVHPLVLAVAGLLEVKEVYAVGGAQAIAALTYGTESIPAVHKIVGPGNAYVNEAKRQVFGVVGIDALAGPTEVVILADESANPEYIVRDLFAQAEHDTEARAILLTTSKILAGRIQEKVKELIKKAPRQDILKGALEKYGAVVLVGSLKEGARLVNQIAPEHLQIMTQNPEAMLKEVKNAGAICLGAYTPVVVGDYFAGPNHVLPTSGNAKFSSPLGVLDYMKFSSLIKFSKGTLARDAAKIAKFAELEGLLNHKFSIECRNERISRGH